MKNENDRKYKNGKILLFIVKLAKFYLIFHFIFTITLGTDHEILQ